MLTNLIARFLLVAGAVSLAYYYAGSVTSVLQTALAVLDDLSLATAH